MQIRLMLPTFKASTCSNLSYLITAADYSLSSTLKVFFLCSILKSSAIATREQCSSWKRLVQKSTFFVLRNKMVSGRMSFLPEMIRKSSEVSGKFRHFRDLGLVWVRTKLYTHRLFFSFSKFLTNKRFQEIMVFPQMKHTLGAAPVPGGWCFWKFHVYLAQQTLKDFTDLLSMLIACCTDKSLGPGWAVAGLGAGPGHRPHPIPAPSLGAAGWTLVREGTALLASRPRLAPGCLPRGSPPS